MSCPVTLKGMAKDCDRNNMGGLKKIMIADYSTITSSPTITEDGISSITGTYFEYYFRKGTCSMVSNVTIDDVNGITYFKTDVTMKFSKLDSAKRAEIMSLILGDVAVIVQDQNNKYWYLGFDNPVTAESATAETGTAFADFNGYTIMLSDMSSKLPYEVTAEAIASLTPPTP